MSNVASEGLRWGRALAVGAALLAGSGSAAEEPPLRVFYIGHSLQSDIPDMVKSLAASAGGRAFEFKEQFIPGAPLRWQWNEGRQHAGEPVFQGTFDRELAAGKWGALVLTDSVPRGGEELEAESADYLGRFVDFAREHQPRISLFFYETWHHLTSGTERNSEYDTASPRRTLKWRERLDADRAMWRGIVERVNGPRAGRGEPVRIIPAGQAMGRLSDAADKGEAPGLTSIRDAFDDEIHPNPYGKYLVACVHYAVLFGKSPEGLPGDVKGRWGASYWNTPNWQGKSWPPPDPGLVRLMQRIAWETVSGNP